MGNVSSIYDFFLDNLKTFFYPEDWLEFDLNFSKTELMTLLVVKRLGEASMSQICDAMNMPMSTATGIIDRMVNKGLLQRERSETDRRMVVVSLSQTGVEILESFEEVLRGYLDQIQADLTQEEQQILIKVFMKITGILSHKAETPGERETETTVRKIEVE